MAERTDTEVEVSVVDPFRCRMWPLHDRLNEYLTAESCKAEIASFAKHGQLVPVLGRHAAQVRNTDIELIYGARRLFVAQHLNVPLKVRLRDIADQDALIAMDIENRHRKDISPYERGLSYARWLRAGHFKSQDMLAQTLHVSASQVSRLLKLATLPSVVIGAFHTPLDIAEGWGVELAAAWADPGRRTALTRRARAISERTPRPSAREVYDQLVSKPGRSARLHVKRSVDVVVGADGRVLFRVSKVGSALIVTLPADSRSAALLDEIKRAIAAILQPNPLGSDAVLKADIANASRGLPPNVQRTR